MRSHNGGTARAGDDAGPRHSGCWHHCLATSGGSAAPDAPPDCGCHNHHRMALARESKPMMTILWCARAVDTGADADGADADAGADDAPVADAGGAGGVEQEISC